MPNGLGRPPARPKKYFKKIGPGPFLGPGPNFFLGQLGPLGPRGPGHSAYSCSWNAKSYRPPCSWNAKSYRPPCSWNARILSPSMFLEYKNLVALYVLGTQESWKNPPPRFARLAGLKIVFGRQTDISEDPVVKFGSSALVLRCARSCGYAGLWRRTFFTKVRETEGPPGSCFPKIFLFIRIRYFII